MLWAQNGEIGEKWNRCKGIVVGSIGLQNRPATFRKRRRGPKTTPSRNKLLESLLEPLVEML
jgi:hypothetical protein